MTGLAQHKTWILVCLLALPIAVRADVNRPESDIRSYQSIVDRNGFGLKDLPPPPAEPPPAPPPEEPPADIFLTGITTLLSPKRAYLMTKDPKDPRGEAKYFSLTENSIQGGLEVLQIDEKEKKVKIRRSGKEMVLTFESNGIQSVAPPPVQVAAAAAAANRGRPPIGAPPPMPNAQPTKVNPLMQSAASNAALNRGSVPSRPTRVGNPGFTGGMRATDRLQFGGNPGAPGGSSSPDADVPQQPYLTPEEQVLMLELQRTSMPNIPMPPTPGLPSSANPYQNAPPPVPQ